MKIERTQNASRNIMFGSFLKIYQMIVPFIMRTVMINLLGANYLGLNSLFTSVLQVLNLAELGVGSAMIYSMYRPIAEDKGDEICALMRLYRIYYRIIGLIVATVGIVLVPFIPKLIKSDVPANINVYVLYLMNLAATVLSYWLFAYKNSILTAHQRTDITSKVMICTDTIKYISQIAVLYITKNYYYYVIAILITQILNNVITACVADRMYPQYKPSGKLPKSYVHNINCRIRDMFTSKLGAVILNSADSIVISAFLGLTMLAIYQNYFYLISAITSFIAIIFTSCTAGIGNSLVIETKEKNFTDLTIFTFIIVWITGFCTVCFLCLFQPFMEIWVGKDLMLEFSVVICLCVYFGIHGINSLLNLYKDAAGMWHEDRFRPLVTAMTNLLLNLILVNYLGIYGIILSTILAMLIIGMPWLIHNLFTVIFSKEYLTGYLKKLLYYVVIVIVVAIITYNICQIYTGNVYFCLILRLIICCFLSNLLFWLFLHKMPEYTRSLQLLNKITKGKIKILNKRINRQEEQ